MSPVRTRLLRAGVWQEPIAGANLKARDAQDPRSQKSEVGSRKSEVGRWVRRSVGRRSEFYGSARAGSPSPAHVNTVNTVSRVNTVPPPLYRSRSSAIRQPGTLLPRFAPPHQKRGCGVPPQTPTGFHEVPDKPERSEVGDPRSEVGRSVGQSVGAPRFVVRRREERSVMESRRAPRHGSRPAVRGRWDGWSPAGMPTGARHRGRGWLGRPSAARRPVRPDPG